MTNKKMSKKEAEQFSLLLLQKRNFVTGNMRDLEDGVGDSMRASTGGDEADMGSDTFEQDLSLSLLQKEGDVVQKIDAALTRLSDGTFGNCLECAKPIAKARLKVVPWAPYCIDCQRREEAS